MEHIEHNPEISRVIEHHVNEHTKIEDAVFGQLTEPLEIGKYDFEDDDMAVQVSIENLVDGQHIVVKTQDDTEEKSTIISVTHPTSDGDKTKVTANQRRTPNDPNQETTFLSYYPNALGRFKSSEILSIATLARVIDLAVNAKKKSEEQSGAR
jgi:hypothetical protein